MGEVEHKEDKQSSIKVSKSTTGKYSWDMKIYYNEAIRDASNVIDKLFDIDKSLQDKFGG